MKALVLFDSNYGNTQKIAEVIAKEVEAKTINVTDVKTEDLKGIKLLILGSPINGWRPTGNTIQFLNRLEKNELEGVNAASFDTRMKVWYSGDATKKMTKSLKSLGANIITEPEAFIVKDKEGPLLEGEIGRAQDWALKIKKQSGNLKSY